MTVTLSPGARSGSVRIPASKSQAHRLLICAALGREPVDIRFEGLSNDISATIACLRALGAQITAQSAGCWRVVPISAVPTTECELPCGESGSTLRFLLPVAGALGASATFHLDGRLPERPLEPLWSELCAHGMALSQQGALLRCKGRLTPGTYTMPGSVSSQYISGLLLALPLLPAGSTLAVTGAVQSASYISMTEHALQDSAIRFAKSGWTYQIPGSQTYALPAQTAVEGDWSNAAFFLCMGALSPIGVRVEGLNSRSAQGDRAILDVLHRMGAQIQSEDTAVTVRRGALRGVTVDARPIPDLIPVLSVLSAVAEGETQIIHAERLRLKESDRLSTTAALISALGGQVTELPDGLTLCGTPQLHGGAVDAANDHRIAMSAAVAACACQTSVTVHGSECVRKSYPTFWEAFSALKGASL